MSIAAQNFSAGYTGCKVVSNTSANTGSFRGFVVNSTCAISALSGTDVGGVTINFLTQIGLTGVSLNPGIYISVPDGAFITSITLSSGSVVMYNV
jgi:hypothetical protein